MKAGFKSIDISPTFFPIRTYLGEANKIIDPIYANAAVFDNGKCRIAMVSLDVVILEWEYVRRIRKSASAATGIPEENIMICATHNHACPAIVDRPGHFKENDYIEMMIEKCSKALLEAHEALEPVKIGIGSGLESRISFNRRFIKRDGTIITQPQGEELNNILCNEGVIDPEVGVLCARSLATNRITGVMVNFGCHAVHLMGKISAGYPGVLYNRIKQALGRDCVTVFLNGACGNVIHRNYLDSNSSDPMEKTGGLLAETVLAVIRDIVFTDTEILQAIEERIKIRYRGLDELEHGFDKLVNVFPGLIKMGWYDYSLEELKKQHAKSDHEIAVIQALKIHKAVFVTIPAEYFNEHGLRIKRESNVRNTCVVSLANGWLGYIPTREAFTRKGGHESTLALWSKMEQGAGDIMADKAIAMIAKIMRNNTCRKDDK